jgi:hypothetical protein
MRLRDGLAFLQFHDPLLDRVGGDQLVDEDRFGLADPVGAVGAWSSTAGFHQGS